MPSQMYNSMNQFPQSNPIFQMFGGENNFYSRFNAFASNFYSNNQGLSPEQIVRNKIASGEMTQEQFNRFSNIANIISGR
jgi:hypothetical protein